MNSIKALRLACILLAGMVVFGCSDIGGGSEEKTSAVGKTEDGHEVLVFQEGDLDDILIRIDTTAISDTGFTGNLHFKNMKPENIPIAGDIIASTPTKNAEYGFLYKVLEVSTKDGNTVAEVKMARIEEAIENVDFEGEVELEFDKDGNQIGMRMLNKNWFKKAWDWGKKTVTNAVNTVTKFVEDVVNAFQGNAEVDLNDTKKFNGYKEIIFDAYNGNLKGKAGGEVAYTMKFILKITVKSWNIKYLKMSIVQDGKLIFAATMNGTIREDYLKNITSVKMPTLWFWAVIPICITNEISADLKITGIAKTELAAKYELNVYAELGFEYKEGKYYPIRDLRVEQDWDYMLHASGKVNTTFLMGLKSKAFGLAGVQLAAGPGLELSADGDLVGTYVFDNGFHADKTKNAVSLYCGVDFYAGLTLGLWGLNLGSYTFAQKFIPIEPPLYETSLLPMFDAPQIDVEASRSSSKAIIKSRIKKDLLNYHVQDFGFCVEKTKDECKNGGGKRAKFGSLGGKESRDFSYAFDFADNEFGNYSVRLYFESFMFYGNGLGGTYYDKATAFVIDNVFSSSSVDIEPSSSSAVVSSSSSVLASSSSVVPLSSSNPPSSNSNAVANSLTDTRDRQVYRTTVIGTQTWMAQNLNYNAEGSECRNNNTDNCATYGRLYDWNTAMIVCPIDWHLPTNADWDKLYRYIDGNTDTSSPYESSTAGGKLRASEGWRECMAADRPLVYEDAYGFSALPGGGYCGGFSSIGCCSGWWSASESNALASYVRETNSRGGTESTSNTTMNKSQVLFYVRCLRDN